MIYKESYINIIDNTDARIGRCIGLNKKKTGRMGDIITVSIKKLRPDKSTLLTKTKIEKKHIHKALIVNTKKNLVRLDGDIVSFRENNTVLITLDKLTIIPFGTRIAGVIPYELTTKNYLKICSLTNNYI
jgi:ribosomal protein L14